MVGLNCCENTAGSTSNTKCFDSPNTVIHKVSTLVCGMSLYHLTAADVITMVARLQLQAISPCNTGEYYTAIATDSTNWVWIVVPLTIWCSALVLGRVV